MQKTARLISAIVIAAVIVAARVHYRQAPVEKADSNPTEASVSSPVAQATTPTVVQPTERPAFHPVGLEPKTPPSERPAAVSSSVRVISEDSRRVLRECLRGFGDPTLSESPTLSELRKRLVPSMGGVAHREDAFENYHQTLPDGTQRRLHIEGGKIGIFGVDAEGLPVPQGKVPIDQMRKLLDQGTLEKVQTSYRVDFKNGASIQVDEENGEVGQLHLSSNTGSVGCDETHCKCLNAP